MKRWLTIALFAILAVSFAGCGKSEAPSISEQQKKQIVLKVGLVPNQAPDKIKAQYEPFREYLQQKLNMPVELFVASDYSGVVEAMANDKLDVAYFGGLTYVKPSRELKSIPLLLRLMLKPKRLSITV